MQSGGRNGESAAEVATGQREADPREPLAPSDSDDPSRFPYWQRNGQVMPAATMLSSMGFAVFVPYLPVMLQSLGIREHLETWVGQMMLLFYVISFASGPFWGGIADYYGRKIMVLRAMLGMGVLMTLVPFSPSPAWFVFLFSLVGFCNGSLAAAQALLVANTPRPRIASTLARLHTGTLVGQTMGPVLATVAVAVLAQPRALFWISGGLLLTGGLLVVCFVHEVKQLAPGRWRLQWLGDLRGLLAVPRVGALYLLSMVFAVLGSGNITVFSVYVLQLQGVDSIGGGAFWVGAVATALAVSSVISLTIWGRRLDKWDPTRVLIWGTVAAGLTQLPLLILDTPLQLVLARAAFGLVAALMQPCIVRLLKAYSPAGMDARAISYNMSFHFIALGAGPFVAGLVGPVLGLRAYFALTIVFTLCALGIWLRHFSRRQQ